MTGKVELLAPAGDYEGLIGAFNAGADAVYLGGDRFGARAYAGNFTAEQLLKGIRYAHLFGRKVYLAVNTLVKEKEFGELYSYLAPLYEAGLDSVIVQDIGVLSWVIKQFPQLNVHASTQMNITHAYGAQFLKNNGAVRIIPARELSLEELVGIRKKVNIELETFIHGAMCYSYSGQCLFSSILGARSGNRGRCAQPCRLPYQKISGRDGKKAASRKNDWYPLSLKDMCTLAILPDLIEAGITSFKIEGRMKKPEYTAGVTALYRKYIDMYYEKGRSGFTVSASDTYQLQSLYIRDEAGEGYYYRHNGREMITRGGPGYEGADEALLTEIRRRYLEAPMCLAVSGYGRFTAGQPAELTVSCGQTVASRKGADLSTALKQPLSEEGVLKQLKKSGNTLFVFDELNIELSDNVFMPVKEMNELRRQALEQLEERLLRPFMRQLPPRLPLPAMPAMPATEPVKTVPGSHGRHRLHVQVTTAEQWQSAVRHVIERIYIDIDIWGIHSVPPKTEGMEWFAVLPRIFRARSEQYLSQYAAVLHGDMCDGVLIQNVESYEWLRSVGYSGHIVTDHSLYIWNKESWQFWRGHADECYLPLELNKHEISDLINSRLPLSNGLPAVAGMMVYGRIPMMISANCLWESGQAAKDRQNDIMPLTDRYGKQFQVGKKCRHCYNIVYNTVPLSLHDSIRQGEISKVCSSYPDMRIDMRLDFTTETGKETEDVISYFKDIAVFKDNAVRPYEHYTTGHSKRGVE